LQGIESLNTTLTGISGQISTSQDVQASSLVGQGVMVAGNSITVGTSSSTGSTATTPFGFSVDSAVDSSTATITDSTGKVVKTISLGAQTSGVHSFSWNGVEDDGSTAPNGSYNFTISAASAGQTTTATALNYAQVQGVNNNSTTTTLDLGSQGTTTLANVYQII
jgi:flagellar basal-body rod modification protein FlgD